MSIKISGSDKGGKEQIQEYPGRKRRECPEGFQESLMQNLRHQEQDDSKKAGTDAYRIKQGSEEAARAGAYRAERDNGEKTRAVTQRVEETVGVSRLGAAGIRVSAIVGREAVQAAEVRHMRYEESDHIEIAVTEGYILKGKLEGEHVYVEAKYDDGRLEAYQVDTERIQPQTQHKIERFAAETAAVGGHAESL